MITFGGNVLCVSHGWNAVCVGAFPKANYCSYAMTSCLVLIGKDIEGFAVFFLG